MLSFSFLYKQDVGSTGHRDCNCLHQMLKKMCVMHGSLESCTLRILPKFPRIFKIQYLKNEATLKKFLLQDLRPFYEE